MSETTVYRFFNNDTGVHFYTADEREKNYIQRNLTNFSFEGAAYQGVDPLTEAVEPSPVYRFRNTETGVHLYTISESERDAVENLDDFLYQGEAFLAYKTKIEGSIPVYRFLNTATGTHFYTSSLIEKNNLEKNLPEFESEGIAYYALPAETESEEILPQYDFSIELEFGQGTDAFTPEMKTAIEEAADVWENAISHSSFDEEHILTIEIKGEDLGAIEDAYVAKANLYPQELEIDPDNNILPTRGYSTVNINPSATPLFSDLEYFTDMMTHEFAHVMGFGSLWRTNNLVNPVDKVYNADTNAGIVYNYQNNTTDVGIPLTTDVGMGSDLTHWQEETFGNELMTHKAETSGISSPISELTLASLEDLGWNVNYEVAELYPDSSTDLAKL